MLIRDAGHITFRDTLDGEELLSSEIVVNKGPHPEADSDFELFCEVTTEALGSDRAPATLADSGGHTRARPRGPFGRRQGGARMSCG